MFDDLQHIHDRIRDSSPAWMTDPVGSLVISLAAPKGDVYVLRSDPPLVVISQWLYDEFRLEEQRQRAVLTVPCAPLTDHQLAGYFVERARGDFFQRTGQLW